MSLALEVSTIEEILLSDGWHPIQPGSFYLDSYEFGEDTRHPDRTYWLHTGGANGICATGFWARTPDGKTLIAGPLTSLLAIRQPA